MGSMGAIGMIETGNKLGIPRESILAWHLESNHYPPVNSIFIPVAIEAIKYAQKGKYTKILDLKKITGGNGFNKPKMTVEEIMTGLHLWDFIEENEDY